MLDLDMSPYAVFVWSSWALSALVLAAVVAARPDRRAPLEARAGPTGRGRPANEPLVRPDPHRRAVALGVFLTVQLNIMPARSARAGRTSPTPWSASRSRRPCCRSCRATSRPISVLDLKTAGVGKPMIVNVFASWCAPCRLEHPQLMKLKAPGRRRRRRGLQGRAGRHAAPSSTSWAIPIALVLVDREGRAGLDLGRLGRAGDLRRRRHGHDRRQVTRGRC